MDFRQYVQERLPPLAIQREPEIVDELAQHLSDLYEEARGNGFDHDAALARAAAALPQSAEELAHDIRTATRALPGVIADRWRAAVSESDPVSPGSLSMFADLRRDLRYAARMLTRTPGFTVVVILTLALGIGANAVIFSAVDAILLRSAPVADPERLVSMYTATSDGRSRFSVSSYPDYADLRDSGVLESLVAFAAIQLSLDMQGETEAISGEIVTGNYFDTLGVRVPLGRGFSPHEDQPGAPVHVAVLSHAFWQERFAGEAGIINRTISLNGRPYEVIGVAPRGFGGPILGRQPQVWVPMALQPEVRPPSAGIRRARKSSDLLGVRGLRWLNMIGRLRPGTTVDEAASGLDVVSRRLAEAYPDANRGRQSTVVTLGEGPGVREASRPLLRLLSGAVALVLLIACANVASLLLARAVSRRREVAVRMAVGAGGSRLIRQWLTESVLLALLGAGGGLLIAWWGTPILYSFRIPPTVDLRVNPHVLLFTLVVAVSSGLLFGLAPIVQTLRRDTIAALRDEGGAVATGMRAARLRAGFVVMQVALSLMLLIGAGLFIRTLHKAYSVDLGYDVDQVLLADVNLDVRDYAQPQGLAVYQQILDRVNALAGVRAAGAARVTVLSGGSRVSSVSIDGRPVDRDNTNGMDVRVNVVSDRYLDALGISVLRGRGFLPSDAAGSQRVAVVSRSLANALWPGADPIGKQLIDGDDPLAVVGVVPDSVYVSAVERQPMPFFYVPLAQNYESGVTLHVRAMGDPLALLPAVRQAVRNVDHQLVVARPRLLRAEFDRSIGDQRMMATLVGLFGAVALLLAAVGLYGVMSHLASQRTAEIGIRLALGAPQRSILTLVLGEGLRLLAIGTVLGLIGAFAGRRLVEARLFGVAPTDVPTFVVVCGVPAAAGLFACLLPARRAMRIDPSVALRNA